MGSNPLDSAPLEAPVILLDMQTVSNAFLMPGHKMFIRSGLIESRYFGCYFQRPNKQGITMKHLVIDILMKLAKMDVEAKEITAQVEAQSLLLAALLLTAGKEGSDSIEKNINHAILAATQATPDVVQSDIDLLLTHINRLLAVTRYVDEMTIAQGNKE